MPEKGGRNGRVTADSGGQQAAVLPSMPSTAQSSESGGNRAVSPIPNPIAAVGNQSPSKRDTDPQGRSLDQMQRVLAAAAQAEPEQVLGWLLYPPEGPWLTQKEEATQQFREITPLAAAKQLSENLTVWWEVVRPSRGTIDDEADEHTAVEVHPTRTTPQGITNGRSAQNAKYATASFIFGIVALAYPTWITGPIGAVAAIIFGLAGFKSEKRGSAIKGMVFAVLALIVFASITFFEHQTRTALNGILNSQDKNLTR